MNNPLEELMENQHNICFVPDYGNNYIYINRENYYYKSSNDFKNYIIKKNYN